jgi:hypothetical protein
MVKDKNIIRYQPNIKFKSFDKFNKKEQKIIKDQITSEFGETDFEQRSDFYHKDSKYSLSLVSVNEIKDDSSFKTRYDINELKDDIIKDGYDQKHPIFVGCIGKSNKCDELLLGGGNHRFKAVKELIKEKKLKSDYKIPTMIWKF